jgi:hypothetical protein
LAEHGRARRPAPARIEVQGVTTKILLVLTLALAAAPGAQAAFKCKDEKGITHIGDTPPAACANVVMYEVTPSGTVLRKIDPTPSGDQLKARQEEAIRKAEADKAAAEQRRKDRALLATYSSEKDVDTSRDMNLKPIEGRIKSAKDRMAAVDKRQKELEAEMEFYQAGKKKGADAKAVKPPPQLVADLERIKSEKVTLEKSVVGYEKEMQEVRDRYEADKHRWVELKKLHREGKLDLREPKEIEAAQKAAQQQQLPPGTKKYNLYLVPSR